MAQAARTPTVDAHNHFWDIERSDLYWMAPEAPELARLRRSFTPPDLKPEMDAVGVDRSVIVQAARSRRGNLWWLELAERYDYVGAVVGWVDPEAPDVGTVLDEYRRHPAFRGVRTTAENVADPDWLARPGVRRGIGEVARRGLALDLLVRTEHLPHVPRLAEEHPDLRMVVDHLAKPPIASGDLGLWRERLEALVPYPRVWCKVSGLLTEAGPEPTAERIRPVVEFALERFGAGRLMWGSDWPVCLLAADYRTTYETVAAALGPLPAADRAALFGGNAARFYEL
ncbi:MAG: amidohydrolase family protein [Chloroflexota bacterium]|nr:amidohydrolase family protein [Chloroflexota bacterium]